MLFRRATLSAVLVGLLAVGCDDSDKPDPCAGGDTYFYVLSDLELPTVETVATVKYLTGANLDGLISDRNDAMGCKKPDYTSPAPDNEPGVDNAIVELLNIDIVKDAFNLDLQTDTALREGKMLVLIRLSNVTSLANDECVTLDVMLGANPETACTTDDDCSGGWSCNPVTAAGGGIENKCTPTFDETTDTMLANQTFDIDSASVSGGVAEARAQASIVNGRLRSSPVDLDLNIPFEDSCVVLALKKGQLRFTIGDTGLTQGVLGGQLNVDELMVALDPVIIGSEFESYRSTLEMLLGNASDLAPADNTGSRCADISIGLTITGAPAVEGATVTPESNSCTPAPDAGAPP